jgi:hypothetical protein
MKVEANWKGYGEHYPGRVQDVNKDGTYDIKYDDGFTEKRVKASRVEPQKGKTFAPAKPKDDPACMVVDSLESIKGKLDNAFRDISAWLANFRARKSGRVPDVEAPHRVLKDVDAPGPAPPTLPAEVESTDKSKTEELDTLKTELAEKDEEIKKLEQDVDTNDALIRKTLNGGKEEEDDGSDVHSIDDLIEHYKGLISRRNDWIDFLKQKKAKQQSTLYSLGYSPVTLDDVQRTTDDISRDMDKVRSIRDKLKEEDKLDPELNAAIEKLVVREAKLKAKVANLVEADRKAKERRKERAELEAAQKAAGKSLDALNVTDEGDDEVLKAAEEVEAELAATKEGADNLDGGVHPHGDKWWRYRYEHSFVEALLMIFILFLMLLWERFYYFLRERMYSMSDLVGLNWIQHSTLYISWLEFFAGEMMACVLTFLTVWSLGKLGFLDKFVTWLPESSDKMHLPSHGSEYEHLAIDMLVVLFWAIFFYFLLALSLVIAATNKLEDWAELDLLDKQGAAVATGAPTHGVSVSSPTEFVEMKIFFRHQVREAVVRAEVSEDSASERDFALKQLFSGIGDGDKIANFPLWAYLRANVRQGTDVFFRFGVIPWTLMIVTFTLFMYLHYYKQMGYIRIMTFFLMLLVVQLLMVRWYVNRTVAALKNPDSISAKESIHNRVNTEGIIATSVWFNLFILCYGISRVVCQPWMWELHFWVVTYLTLFTLIIAVCFCYYIAPTFPIFFAAMSLPPYIDPENIETMKTVLEFDDETTVQRHYIARKSKKR